jgi:hypothetical protein
MIIIVLTLRNILYVFPGFVKVVWELCWEELFSKDGYAKPLLVHCIFADVSVKYIYWREIMRLISQHPLGLLYTVDIFLS